MKIHIKMKNEQYLTSNKDIKIGDRVIFSYKRYLEFDNLGSRNFNYAEELEDGDIYIITRLGNQDGTFFVELKNKKWAYNTKCFIKYEN